MPWKLTVRAGPRVQRYSFKALEPALEALERRAQELSRTAPRQAVNARLKRFEPIQRVAARLELSGPERFVASARAGVDIRGDGSAEAYRGRVRRREIEPRHDESVYGALRREFESGR